MYLWYSSAQFENSSQKNFFCLKNGLKKCSKDTPQHTVCIFMQYTKQIIYGKSPAEILVKKGHKTRNFCQKLKILNKELMPKNCHFLTKMGVN